MKGDPCSRIQKCKNIFSLPSHLNIMLLDKIHRSQFFCNQKSANGSLVLAYILFSCKYLFFLSECCIFSILGVWKFKWRIAMYVCSNKFYLGIGEHLLIETVSPQLRKIFLYSYVNINFSSSSAFSPSNTHFSCNKIPGQVHSYLFVSSISLYFVQHSTFSISSPQIPVQF